MFAEVIVKIKVTHFFETRCIRTLTRAVISGELGLAQLIES